jgi:hypothetical protein
VLPGFVSLDVFSTRANGIQSANGSAFVQVAGG